ncbi:toll/interleukin-1 receptor domain-containing protein [Leptolyngbya cf. ectocarpi LEGE 11479]|uniref:Toll/interleukin-1 receptor domain-containing protein n=1 Tax=Leptolyngbya cf. ectocarpi LEGE 11479 TaxID=1828722 RepID=A0A929FC83_LEPEC|nr:toll/interleukin-1 receptor domain-containing protein [Leptolyngbya ectocarpi]MBE9069308.1 toll/interleukin-1 receptor domain-containing protein [Leptolyngbya cf. ectocarpi LEGE 11479]
MGKPGSIFISYRRSDSIAEAGRVYDKLVEAFGSERIFKDVDNIPYGADFVEYLDQAVARCDVLIALMGRSWLTVTDSHGKRRLDDPNDFVRIEIASALKRDILVLPVLIGGATMPGPSDLPDDLQSLARRNAAQARYDPDFHSDMRRIVTKLEDYFADRGITATSGHNTSTSPAQPTPNTVGIRVSMILSGVSGVFALYDSISGIGTAAGGVVAALLFGSVAILMTRKVWAWGSAIAIQVSALIVFSAELMDVFSDSYQDSEVSLDDLAVIIPVMVLALITIVILLSPKTRRNFS